MRQKLKTLKMLLFSWLVPPTFRFAVVEALKKIGLIRDKNAFYSQFGEDAVLGALFAGQSQGFYVDVGAHHPTKYSNTHLLYTRGWHGINIEPNPEAIKLFQRARPDDANVCSGIAEQPGHMKFWLFSDPLVSTFSEQDAKKWMEMRAGETWITLLGTQQVPVTTLRAVLEQHLPKDVPVDVLSVDTEGFDFQVLRSNDWERCKPRVIVVEVDHAKSDAAEMTQYLTQKRYRPLIKMGPSQIFMSDSMAGVGL